MIALPAIDPRRLVERDDELAALLAVLAEPPAVAIVHGEPGIGKSRLIREALHAPALRTRQVLIGEAHAVRNPFPLGPVLEALVAARLPPADKMSPVVGALRPLLPERAADLPPALEGLEDKHAERHRIVRALVEIFHALGPAVLVLEDLHWSDERTLEVLGLLAARPSSELSIVASYRSDDLSHAPALRALLAELHGPLVTRVELRPLSEAGVAELAAQVLGAGDVSAGLARDLNQRTSGVPFLIEEDVQSLRESGLLVQRAGVWRPPATQRPNVPISIAVAVLERAARLSAEAQAVIEATAVLGSPADEDLLYAVCGLDDAAMVAGLSDALSAGLLRESERMIGFRHALGRDAIHEAIPSPRRRQLHLAAAKALEDLHDAADLGQLAHHFAEAGRTQEWALYAEAAADLASSLGEDQTAYGFLRELLEAGAVPTERRAEVTQKVAWAAPSDADENEATVALLHDALAQPDLPAAARGELLAQRGWRLLLEPDTSAAGFADLRTAVAELHDRPAQQARVLATLGAPWAADTTLREHFELLEAARAAAARSADAGARAHVAADTLSLLMASGDPRAWEALADLPEPSESAGVNRQLLRALNNAAGYACDLGHYRRARDIVARALRIVDEVGQQRIVPWVQLSDLNARWAMGMLDGVEEDLEEALRRSGPGSMPGAVLLRGELLLERAALEEAHAALTGVAAGWLAQGELGDAARAGAGIVRIAVARDDEAAALAQARRFLEAIAETDIWVRAAPLLPFAPLPAVREVLDSYSAGVAGRDAPLATTALAFVHGRLAEADGDREAAAAAFADARERAAAMPNPRLAAHAAEAEARTLGATAGRTRYEEAWTTFTELDAPWEANRVKHAMREAGLRLPHRGGRRSYGEALSPREHEVAKLAAAGQTNREIAQELYLSPRTVDTHLANSLRKLNISSRRDLAEALVDEIE